MSTLGGLSVSQRPLTRIPGVFFRFLGEAGAGQTCASLLPAEGSFQTVSDVDCAGQLGNFAHSGRRFVSRFCLTKSQRELGRSELPRLSEAGRAEADERRRLRSFRKAQSSESD